MEENEKIDKLVALVLFETIPKFYDNPNGGHSYTCPFCLASKEVKASECVSICELEHTEDCTYKLAQDIYKIRLSK